MKKIAFIISTIILIFVGRSQAQKDPSLLEVKVDVVYLASDFLEGRETGTKGEDLAAEYISLRFAELGLSPRGEGNSWLQPFDFKTGGNPHAPETKSEERTGKNVIGFLDNNAEHTIVIGAHYDHLGFGESGSLHPEKNKIHNGADDNASGVAAVFQLAKRLKAGSAPNNNYLFIAFSGEELGLYGSKHFAANPTIDLTTVNYMINMDMVGRYIDPEGLVITGTGTSPIWEKTFEKVKGDIILKMTPDGIGPSDHTSFYLKNIPVMHLFTGLHTDYHKPSDDSYLINFYGILTVCNFIEDVINELDNQPKLTFTKTKVREEKKAANFKVTLGIMPDYVFQGEGMRIDAVIENRPAQLGGLKDGDIIIKIGEVEVNDIYQYMEGLSKFNPGEKAIVVVKRGDTILKKEVTF